MGVMVPSLTAVAVIALSLCSLASFVTGADVQGKVGYTVDGVNIIALKAGAVTELQLTSSSGEQIRTFADRDGKFTLRDVAPGSYVLTTQNPGFVYPELLVDVTAKAGLARAAYTFNKHQISTKPFIIRPAAQAQYYELRKPLDLWSFIKSPYGLMIGFMLFGIFVFPMMKVDPEEYREAMAQLRGDDASQQQQPQQQRIRDR